MSEVLVVKNISREGPGLLDAVLAESGVPATVVDLDKGDAFPSPLDYKALVVLGGPDSANDTTPKMTAELNKVRAALDAGMPYLGICLGMQVGVKAGGGKVVRAPQKEVGFIDPNAEQFVIDVSEAGKDDPLLVGLGDALEVFHLHGETVELTDSMQLLGTGKYCKNQIVKIANKAYGIQSHFELTEEMLRVWAQQDPDLVPLGEQALVEQYRAIQERYTTIGRTIFQNFLRSAQL